jgi:hypothetical protein
MDAIFPAGFFVFSGLEGGNHQTSSLFIERLFRDIRPLGLVLKA